MKTPKERQRAYRERRKAHKNAGLTKLKILASVTTAKRLEILSAIDNTDIGNILGQAVGLIWTQRFGNSETAPERAMGSEEAKAAEPEKPAKVKPEKSAKAAKVKIKLAKPKSKTEPENPAVAAEI